MSFHGLVAHFSLVLNDIHCLEGPQFMYPFAADPTVRGGWWATAHVGRKELDTTE